MGSCSNATSCAITTLSIITGRPIKQTLDSCTVEGVASGNRVSGVAASTALAPGRCSNSSDCGVGDRWQCSYASNFTVTSCNNGQDSTVSQGTCQLSAAAVCSDCLASAQSFAVQQLTATNGTALAWQAYCSSNQLASAAQCNELATKMNTDATAGKRAAYMCTIMLGNTCSRALTATVKVTAGGQVTNLQASALDLCTVEGVPAEAVAPAAKGTIPPGFLTSTAVPDGYCNATCSNPTDNCDTTKPYTLSKCTSATGALQPIKLGTCVANDTFAACLLCNRCINALQSYVNQVRPEMNATTVTEAWLATCMALNSSAIGLSSANRSSICQGIYNRIKADGRFGKRAGALCIALKSCSPVTDCKLTVGSYVNANLDTCTAQVRSQA